MTTGIYKFFLCPYRKSEIQSLASNFAMTQDPSSRQPQMTGLQQGIKTTSAQGARSIRYIGSPNTDRNPTNDLTKVPLQVSQIKTHRNYIQQLSRADFRRTQEASEWPKCSHWSPRAFRYIINKVKICHSKIYSRIPSKDLWLWNA